MRRCIALGALLTLGISPFLLQCQDEARPGEQVAQTGDLSLPLEAAGESGNIYRLRHAVFRIERQVASDGAAGGSGGSNATGGTGSVVSVVTTSGTTRGPVTGGPVSTATTGSTGGVVQGSSGGQSASGGHATTRGMGSGGPSTAGPTGGFTGTTGSFGSGGTGATGGTGAVGGVGGTGAAGGTGAYGGVGGTGAAGGTGAVGGSGTGGSGVGGSTGGSVGGNGTRTTGGSGNGGPGSTTGSTGGFGFASANGSAQAVTATATSGGSVNGPAVTVSGTSGFSVVTGSVTGSGGSGGSSGEFELVRVLSSEDFLSDPQIVTSLRSGEYRITLEPGWVMERITPSGERDFVGAELVSNSVQFAGIFPDETSVVFYSFIVGGDQVIFGQDGDLVIGIDVKEVSNSERRSLIETSLEAVSQFSLAETLDAIGANAGLRANGLRLYQQIIDSYASAPGNLASAAHCGDQTVDGQPTLNGYPILCDRLEAQQFDNLGAWIATAVVNRIDLAPENGSHCGQQRLIFANNEPIGNSRMFMILEPQIPNPRPELGVQGCAPIAEFWRSLEAVDDPVARGARLREAFVTEGLPGFGPFMQAQRFSTGTGQIRTNNFDHSFWTLREFKLVDAGDVAEVRPFPVAEAPHGELWNDNVNLPFGPACRDNFLQALEGLLTDDPAKMAFVVDRECKDAESPNDNFTQDYRTHLSGSTEFFSLLEERLAGTRLGPFNIARRAQFAGSCIGCHQEATGVSLGRDVVSPRSNGFVHVSEQFVEDCGNNETCFGISPALKEVFLPHRAQVQRQLLAEGGTGGSGAGGAPSDTATTTGAGGEPSDYPQRNAGSEERSDLASADLDTEELAKRDERAKADWGKKTIGGQPAGVSH